MTALALGAFGSLIGSFLNVVVYRVPAGRSIVTPPSACGACGHAIRWYDNVPVISWLVLRGRCRDCSARISVRYPLVELGSALFFALVALVFVPPIAAADDVAGIVAGIVQLAALLYLAAISIALALIDIDTQRLPDVIVMPAYIVSAAAFTTVAALTGAWAALLTAGIGMLILGGFYLLILLVRPDAMGFGDVKLAGVLGFYLGWLGWASLAVGAIGGLIIGGLVGVVMLASRGRKARIAYGPWLLAGAWLGILAGPAIATWYLGIFGLTT
jgi:leader peptidase (prepilin peptidase)/N-methyltransferase